MEEKKVTNSGPIRLRRNMRLDRPATPAGSTAPITSSLPWPRPSEAALLVHNQRAEAHVSKLQEILAARRPPPMQNLGDEPPILTPAAPLAPPSVEPPRRRLSDNRDPPASGAKLWKKPWDK